MNLVRRIILGGLLGMSLFLLWDVVLRSPCMRVVEYDIGDFDERFGIKREFLLSYLASAENPWEQALDRELFRYVPGADFKVNLIWSEEQDRIMQGHNLEKNLDDSESSIQSLQSRYQSAVRRYESAKKEYETILMAYEKDVSFWNAQGGAPEKEYVALQQRSTILERKVSEVQTLLSKVNHLAEENNQKVKNHNATVKNYNNLFNEGSEFDAGNTDGTEINIYSYADNQELTTLLVHEFGHVLGLDHVDDESSIMYYLLNEKNKKGTLSEHDIHSLESVCKR